MKLFYSIAGFFYKIGQKCKVNKRYMVTVYSAIALLVVVGMGCFITSCGKNDTDKTDTTVADQTAEEVSENQVDTPDYTVPDTALEENAYADVNDFVNRYFSAMTNGDVQTLRALKDSADDKEMLKNEKESAYIDEFDNIKVYTKPGPYTGSYVAFVYYEIKFANINTLAPGLTTMYIRTKEDGSLYICESGITDDDNNYVKNIVAQQDVVDLFSMVETKYAEAVDSDADLNTFLQTLSTKLDLEVSQALAEASDGGEDSQTAEASDGQQDGQAENVTEEKVKATDTVNVRNSDSENADRIGQIAMGDTITRYETKENGWSRVDYNGQTGYIKSEYLEPVEQPQAQTEQPTQETEAPAENAQPEQNADAQPTETANEQPTQTGSLAGKKSVTIKDTVNVRKSSSTDAEKIGVAYQGEHYDLVMEQADGWCKIKFNGQTGYVKTEFVE